MGSGYDAQEQQAMEQQAMRVRGTTGVHVKSGRAVRVLVALAASALVGVGLSAMPSQAADSAEIYLVQGLPTQTVDVEIDGKQVEKGLKATAVAGPFKVKAGDHEVTVSSAGKTLTERMVDVGAGSSWDVVAHLPADPDGDPTMTAYRNDLSAVPGDKSSLTVAHTASVPPADIRVDGKVLFSDVANGESLNLVVPVATYGVDIVPTGEDSPVFLGPLKLTTQGGALNRVFAVGDPRKKTMNVAVHVLKVKDTGSGTPDEVNTGTGGQAVGADSGLQVDLVR
jgi:Domain of unknown function (DUF4397)